MRTFDLSDLQKLAFHSLVFLESNCLSNFLRVPSATWLSCFRTTCISCSTLMDGVKPYRQSFTTVQSDTTFQSVTTAQSDTTVQSNTTIQSDTTVRSNATVQSDTTAFQFDVHLNAVSKHVGFG